MAMIKKLLACLIIAGACNAYPHDDESTVVPTPGPVYLEKDIVVPERGPINPVNPEKDVVDPEKEPFPVENEPLPSEVPVPQGGPNSDNPDDSDLKTDATFWWPYYRSSWSYPTYTTYWSYPTYRSYWSYPRYRYYRPRTYYSSYYYW